MTLQSVFRSVYLPWAFPLAPPPHWCQGSGPCRAFPYLESTRQSRALSAFQRCWPLTHSRTQWSVGQRPVVGITLSRFHFGCFFLCFWCESSPLQGQGWNSRLCWSCSRTVPPPWHECCASLWPDTTCVQSQRSETSWIPTLHRPPVGKVRYFIEDLPGFFCFCNK